MKWNYPHISLTYLYEMRKAKPIPIHVGMGAVVHIKVHVKYQSCSSKFLQHHSYCDRCTGSGDFLVFRRCGLRGTRRGTPFAAQTAAGNAIRAVVDQGMQRAEVMIKGPGLGRDAAWRAIRRSGILFSFVRDVSPMPHNGCRPPKKGVCRKKH